MPSIRVPKPLLIAAASALALTFAWGGSSVQSKSRRAKAKPHHAAPPLFYSCEQAKDKRPAEARLLHRDPLNSGAWVVPGIDPLQAPIVEVWSCRKEYIEPSGQRLPVWRNKQNPPLPPPRKFDVCEKVSVTKIAKNRAWFPCSPTASYRIRLH